MANLNNLLIPKNIDIFFDPDAHRYTDQFGIQYTSCTTVIGKYHEEFKKKDIAEACARIGKNPKHPKYEMYKGKTAKALLYQWDQETIRACTDGSSKHDFLENTINNSNNYKAYKKKLKEKQLYTIDHIISNHNYGKINLSDFKKSGIDIKYPRIFEIISILVKDGFSIYAEIAVYDSTFAVSGLIDVLAVNHKTGEFIILDWKTNKAPIRFDAGYYGKTVDGRLDLNKWNPKNEFMEYPIENLSASVGNKYAMQLSTYAYLVSTFGYKCVGLVLCHIRPIENMFKPRTEWEEELNVIEMPYLESETKRMISHFSKGNSNQLKMMFK